MRLSLRTGGSIVLVLWLCLATWVGLDLRQSRERGRQAAERVAATLTKVLEGHLQATVRKIDLRLSEFIENHGDEIRHRAPRAAVEPELARFLSLFPEAVSFRVADAAGRYLYDASGTLSDFNVSGRAYFQVQRDDPAAGLFISEPLKSQVSGDWVIVLSRRIEDRDRRFAGILVGTVRIDFFERFYGTLDVGSDGSIALWSAAMELVARWPRREDWRGRKLEGSPIPQRIAAGETMGSFSRAAMIDGQRRLFVFRKVEGLPFVFSVGMTEEEFLAEWRRRALTYAVLGTLLSAALAALVLAWARSHARVLRQAEARIESLATCDQMTDLPNRQGFIQALNAWLAAGRAGALLIFDLDNLGRINDAFGHEAGDTLLRATGQRLRRLLREDDVLGRLGGDQFGVLAGGRGTPEHVETVVRKLLDAIALPLAIDGSSVVSTACAGICLFPGDGTETAALLRNADAAMHNAKAEGANRFRFFSRHMNHEMAERLRMESSLRAALDGNELLLHYQPQFDLASGRLVGVESLLRWRHPELGIVAPSLFIPLAEETRLILPIGRWVLIEACRQNRAWQDAGLPPWTVAVNLSALQFQDGSIVAQVREALALSGLAPRWLELEITESVIMQEPERIAGLLGELKALGVRLSIDDFGTGYSSLAYLKRFPLDKIKIDRSFVTDIERDPNDAAIVRMIIGIAKELELRVIAEGVETEGQRAFLQGHACDEIQGFLLGRPQPAEAISAIAAGT
jgi:diguanylate cyclase (GGDEF)-like protein